jgi:hypothetical protein
LTPGKKEILEYFTFDKIAEVKSFSLEIVIILVIDGVIHELKFGTPQGYEIKVLIQEYMKIRNFTERLSEPK